MAVVVAVAVAVVHIPAHSYNRILLASRNTEPTATGKGGSSALQMGKLSPPASVCTGSQIQVAYNSVCR